MRIFPSGALRHSLLLALATVLVISSIVIIATTLHTWLSPLSNMPDVWQLSIGALLLALGSVVLVVVGRVLDLPLWIQWLVHPVMIATAIIIVGEDGLWSISTLWLAMSLLGAIWLLINWLLPAQRVSNIGRRSLAEDVAWVSARIESKALAVAHEASQGAAALTAEAQQQRADAYASLQLAQQMRQSLSQLENPPPTLLRSNDG